MPSAASFAATPAACRTPSSQADGASCCEPTWKDTPPARRPSRTAWDSSSVAISGAQPNFLPNGVSEPVSASSTRQNTEAPGACSARCSTSARLSEVNRRTPSSKARAMSARFLIVLP